MRKYQTVYLSQNFIAIECYCTDIDEYCIALEYQKKKKKKKNKRKVQGVPQLQTTALPRSLEEEKPTNLNKHKPNKRTESTKISSLFPKRGNRNTKSTEKHKNKNDTRKHIQQIAP